MPCNTVITIELAQKNWNLETLKNLMESAGYNRVEIKGDILTWQWGSHSYNKTTGEISISGYDKTANQKEIQKIRSLYGQQINRNHMMKWKNLGWRVQEVQNG